MLASRSGATENEVRPSTDRPISERTPQLDAAVRARRRVVVDTKLAKADPGRQSLEEAVALRQASQGCGGARRKQAEVASVRRNFLAGAPIYERVKAPHGKSPGGRFVLAVRLGGEDDIVAIVEPMPDKDLDQIRRVLSVAIDEQHRSQAGVLKPGEQGGFLAEVARQRDHLDVAVIGAQ